MRWPAPGRLGTWHNMACPLGIRRVLPGHETTWPVPRDLRDADGTWYDMALPRDPKGAARTRWAWSVLQDPKGAATTRQDMAHPPGPEGCCGDVTRHGLSPETPAVSAYTLYCVNLLLPSVMFMKSIFKFKWFYYVPLVRHHLTAYKMAESSPPFQVPHC